MNVYLRNCYFRDLVKIALSDSNDREDVGEFVWNSGLEIRGDDKTDVCYFSKPIWLGLVVIIMAIIFGFVFSIFVKTCLVASYCCCCYLVLVASAAIICC